MSLKKLYRKTFRTEDVNLVGWYKNDKWNYQTESVSIPQFDPLCARAVVIGNGITANEFDLTKIIPYREITAWGQAGPWVSKRQTRTFFTYGCNAIYRNYKPDFVAVTGADIVDEIANSPHDKTNIIYAYNKYLELYPGKFNILPQNPEFNAGAIAAYMAAFDEHKTVYLLGFDGIDSSNNNYNIFAGTPGYPQSDYAVSEQYWVRSLNQVMQVYADTEFVRVAPTRGFRQPEVWKDNLNYRQIDFRQFVLEADV